MAGVWRVPDLSIGSRGGSASEPYEPADRNVEGVVEMMLDARRRYDMLPSPIVHRTPPFAISCRSSSAGLSGKPGGRAEHQLRLEHNSAVTRFESARWCLGGSVKPKR
jgi:hypothetical protein